MEQEFRAYRCRFCGGVAHPASGCQYTETFIVCGPCVRQTFPQVVAFTASKGRRRGPAFYESVNRVDERLFVASAGFARCE